MAGLYFGLVGPMLAGILGVFVFAIYHGDTIFLGLLFNGASYSLGYMLSGAPFFSTGVCFGLLRVKLMNKIRVSLLTLSVMIIAQPVYLLCLYQGTITVSMVVCFYATLVSTVSVFLLIWLRKAIIGRV